MTQLQQILPLLPEQDNFQKVSTYANHVYIGERFVLKIYDSVNEWDNTLRVYKLISEQELEAPKIIASNPEPAPFILMTKLSGVPISEETTVENYESLGEWVGKLHNITFSKFGGLTEEGVGPFYEIQSGPFDSWKSMHLELVKDRIKSFKGATLEALKDEILNFFQSCSYSDFKPSLIHEDLNQKNIFVQNGKISGVIDPDGGFAGCTEEELMRIEVAHFVGREDLRDAFLRGYQRHHSLLEGYEQRRPLFRLSRTLVEVQCLVNHADYKADHKEQAMNNAVDQILSIIRAHQKYRPARIP
ncbi:MAG: phosphotransferase [Nanoarchaeota archaeon]